MKKSWVRKQQEPTIIDVNQSVKSGSKHASQKYPDLVLENYLVCLYAELQGKLDGVSPVSNILIFLMIVYLNNQISSVTWATLMLEIFKIEDSRPKSKPYIPLEWCTTIQHRILN